MADQEVIDYIKQALASGREQDSIRQALLGVGWSATEVDDAFFFLEQDGEYAIKKEDNTEHHGTGRPKKLLAASVALIAIAAAIYALHVMKFF